MKGNFLKTLGGGRGKGMRRFSGAASFIGKKAHDPYVFVIAGQLALCALLILCAYTLASSRLEAVEQVRSGGRVLLEESFSADELMSRALPWITRSLDDVSVQASYVWNAITGRDANSDDEASGEAVSSQQVSAVEHNALRTLAENGSGAGLSAPEGCALWPVYISSIVQPPVSGAVTCLYGWREHPITGAEDFHRGLDIAASLGTEIRIPMSGVVEKVDSSAVYGNYVTIEHGNGVKTTYCHCEQVVVTVGENLRRGELVAYVGSTGMSTGPHVHFELSKDGVYYNPAWVVRGMGNA